MNAEAYCGCGYVRNKLWTGMVATSDSVTGPRGWADRLGTWTSALCVVHCVLTPVLLSLSAVAAHVLPSEESVHRSLALLVALFGAVALLVGYRRHRRARVLGLMLAGLALIAGAAWWGDRLPGHLWEVGITVCGSACMIAAHRMNHTFCRECACGSRANRS